jgi:hypothetical protein
VSSTVAAGPSTRFALPPASITVLRGKVVMQAEAGAARAPQ